MVTVLLLIFLAMLILGSIGCTKSSGAWESAWLALVIFGGLGTLAFGELKSESYITLISYYPELKSDELVQRQLDVYEDNSQKLKSLRQDLIDVSKSKWRVYFGH